MLECNLIIVFNAQQDEVLMCHRIKDPYRGKLNFVGGKKQVGESDLAAAYRELFEETHLSSTDIELLPVFRTTYAADEFDLFVYMGVLEKEVEVISELNPLQWVSLSEDFQDESRFAGNGNISHMLAYIQQNHAYFFK